MDATSRAHEGRRREYIPTPARANDLPFLMAVEDMTISGRGTVATGRVERSELKLNEPVEIVGIKDTQSLPSLPVSRCSVSPWTFCEAGDNVGLLLRGISAGHRARPGSLQPVRLPRTPSSPARSTF